MTRKHPRFERRTGAAPRNGLAPLATVAILVLAGCTTSHGAPPPTSTTTDVAPRLDAARAAVIERGLVSTDTARVAGVLDPSVAATYRKSPGRFWPKGTVVSIRWRQLHVVSPALATVPAITSGALPARWVFLLTSDNGRWLVAATRRVGS